MIFDRLFSRSRRLFRRGYRKTGLQRRSRRLHGFAITLVTFNGRAVTRCSTAWFALSRSNVISSNGFDFSHRKLRRCEILAGATDTAHTARVCWRERGDGCRGDHHRVAGIETRSWKTDIDRLPCVQFASTTEYTCAFSVT